MSFFHLPFTTPSLPQALKHADKVLLMGSCFTEHIGNKMEEAKMRVRINLHGILFNPLSIAESLEAYIKGRIYTEQDIFCYNEIWHSWGFHSRFSHTDKEAALAGMRESAQQASAFLQTADWLLVTFGSAYRYYTTAQSNTAPGYGVANCHKAPGQWFEKRLLPLEEMEACWKHTLHALRQWNPGIRILFTVSPVRHIRDGLAENNRSKARLIELVHRLVEQEESCFYFPAYELVMDVLRDYRFFDPDMVHPNGQAAQYVWEQFVPSCMDRESGELLKRIKEITTAAQHRSQFPETSAGKSFRTAMLHKLAQLQADFPYLDLEQEKLVFNP